MDEGRVEVLEEEKESRVVVELLCWLFWLFWLFLLRLVSVDDNRIKRSFSFSNHVLLVEKVVVDPAWSLSVVGSVVVRLVMG